MQGLVGDAHNSPHIRALVRQSDDEHTCLHRWCNCTHSISGLRPDPPTSDRWIGWCQGMGVGGCNGLKICWLTFPTVLGLARSLGWLYETFWDSNDLMVVFPNCSGTASVPLQHGRGSALAGSLPARGLPGGSPLAPWWLSRAVFRAFRPPARPHSLGSRCHALSV